MRDAFLKLKWALDELRGRDSGVSVVYRAIAVLLLTCLQFDSIKSWWNKLSCAAEGNNDTECRPKSEGTLLFADGKHSSALLIEDEQSCEYELLIWLDLSLIVPSQKKATQSSMDA